MIRQFTTKRDVIMAFANAMNLISPEVENHHEKVAYLAARLAEMMGMTEEQRYLAFLGGLTHDIGGVMHRGSISLLDLEHDARAISARGASLLRLFPLTLPLSDVVLESQTPWEKLKSLPGRIRHTQRLGQIIHLADVVALLLSGEETVLNQVSHVKECVHAAGPREFAPEVLDAFDRLCGVEAVWMDVLYRPQLFLDMVSGDRWLSLEEVSVLTRFMSRIIDFRSPFTAMHSAGVAATASLLAGHCGMSDDECEIMRIAGYLHDIGKLKIPNEILEKPGKLTDREFNIMKEHAYFTWALLKDVRGFERITDWAALHHEMLDGSGYPFHLPAGELSLGSRIMTVADVFSALTEDRPYRRSMEREGVIQILRGDAERGLLSAPVTELLIENYDEINDCRMRVSAAASRHYQASLAAEKGGAPEI